MKSCHSAGLGFRAAGVVLLLLAAGCREEERPRASAGYEEWKVYGGSPEHIQYSSLDQINRDNVDRLQVAWQYDTGDAFEGSEMQCNPIVVDGVLYATTPRLRVIALDAATGQLRWSFDPLPSKRARKSRNRGVSYWGEGEDKRILFVARKYLYALHAGNGNLVESFGEGGRVDLREGLGRDSEGLSVSATSPGMIYKDLLILGSLVSEALPAAPGDIRAFDVRSGKIRWSFHTIPHPGEFGYETWPPQAWKSLGGANNWAGMSLDPQRGLVFCPTGSAAFDFYGANRVGDNLFANSLLVLRAETGERVWHFQAVRHDVWDRDLPAPPGLVTVRHNDRWVDAAAQITKSGHLFLLDRETGEPLFPIEDRQVPASDVEGEVVAETQPLPLRPLPFARQLLSQESLTRRTPAAHQAVMERFGRVRSGDQFTPPSLQGTVIFPGFDGGGEWGGGAFDPETGIFYVNSNEMAWILRLVERPPAGPLPSGRALYLEHCASCHKSDLSGSPPEFPSLSSLPKEGVTDEVEEIIHDGAGRMPGYAQLGGEAIRELTRYLISGQDASPSAEGRPLPLPELKYTHGGYNKFLDPDGYPAVEPPWGTLSAIDLDSGEYVWKIPFGEFPELTRKGLKGTGSENYGGPVVTAGGLLFIGATTHDRKFRAFDKASGEILWKTTLPAAGNATPAIYQVQGRQYVVIAAGGGKWGNPSGGVYVAFSLPKEGTSSP
ncbi:MAG: PQQ-binding-like beta-propeller repeat protein [Acidobacteriota bacterium]